MNNNKKKIYLNYNFYSSIALSCVLYLACVSCVLCLYLYSFAFFLLFMHFYMSALPANTLRVFTMLFQANSLHIIIYDISFPFHRIFSRCHSHSLFLFICVGRVCVWWFPLDILIFWPVLC